MTEVGNLTKKLIEYFGDDVRRINHAMKVYAFAKGIAEIEGLCGDTLSVIEAAGLLHDVGIKVSERLYNSSAGHYQEQEGPEIARKIMQQVGLNGEIIERVCYIIGNHHTYSKIDGTDFQILVEADFLVNIYEDEIGTEQVRIIAEKYFKTAAGKTMIEGMYLS